MRITHRTEGHISLIQQDHRKFSTGYEYSMVRLILLKIDKASGHLNKYISDFVDCDRDGTVKVELDPGDYYIVAEVDWKGSFTRDIVLNFYGQHPVAFVEDRNELVLDDIFNEIVVLHQKFTEKERIY